MAAPVTGRLVAPTLVLGASVSTGDVLIALEPLVDAASRATSEAQRRELQGQIEAARAQVEARQVAMRRMSTLVASGLATEAERAQAEAELTAERARVDSLRRASDELARMTGGRIELRAPVAGVVALLLTGAGSVVPQGEIVARIVKAGPRWIDLAVPPADPVGSGYRVQGLSDVVAARLVTRGAFIQSDGTRRDRLEVSEDAASNLPPGATLPVEVLHETTGLVVPLNALVRHAHKALVFVQVEPGRYESREVQVGARADERAVVTSGLSAGANVVAQGAPSLLGELVADVEGGREADE